MTEIIVAGFSGVCRAAHVLNAMPREARRVDDLDDAIIVARSENGELRVQQAIGPMTDKNMAWGNLWGSLISASPMIPETGGTRAVARAVTTACGQSGVVASTLELDQAEANWWQQDFGISFDFVHDVESLLGPGKSAIFLLLRAPTGAAMINQVRAYGATVIRIWLSAHQDARLQTVLTDTGWHSSGLCLEPGPEQRGGLDLWSEYYRCNSLAHHR